MSDRGNALANIDRRIAEARTRLELQREILKFAEGGPAMAAAQDMFSAIQRTIEDLEEDRRQIEDEVNQSQSDRG
jgi:DNA-directed RNA polymerase beta' subunit